MAVTWMRYACNADQCRCAHLQHSASFSVHSQQRHEQQQQQQQQQQQSEPATLVGSVAATKGTLLFVVSCGSCKQHGLVRAADVMLAPCCMMMQVLFEHFAAEFQKKTGLGVRTNPKAAFKLRNQVEKVSECPWVVLCHICIVEWHVGRG